MLYAFLVSNRNKLINRCQLKSAERHNPNATDSKLRQRGSLFLDQVIKIAKIEKSMLPHKALTTGFPDVDITETVDAHERLKERFKFDQVIHDYDDLCEAITDVAFDQKISFKHDEFKPLNHCLDNAIADLLTDILISNAQKKAVPFP